MSRIQVIEPEDASGRLLKIYQEIIEKRGKLAEVHKIQSLHPESIVKHMDLYLEIMFSKCDLSRGEREMMAVVASVNNKCEYCRSHHAEALNHYWKDESRITRFINNYKTAELNNRQRILCEFAEKLTLDPGSFTAADIIERLKSEGLSDSAILDATLVVAYFNFVNRIVLALGVESTEEEIKGYNF